MITLIRDARALLDDQTFVGAWQRLYDRCPWGTVNQSVEFVKIWSDVYDARYELVLVADREGTELAGLLPLAVERSSHRVIVAGGIYSEYQVWLADPDSNDQFIADALDAVRDRLPRQRLQFVFVPPSTPLDWTSRGAWAGRCEVRSIPRALMDVSDTAKLQESLRKKHNRSHVNHLQRHGPLTLTAIATGAEMSDVHDEINAFSLLRLSGVHGEPIVPDPLKKPLFARLVDAGIVHATLLRAGDALVSAQVHWRNKGQSLRGMSAFSPVFAQHSPSNVHTLMLGLELARAGTPTVDLTPGGEYKERFATHEDTAYILTIFANAGDRLRQNVRTRAARAARRLFAAASPAPAQTPEWQRAITEAVKQRSPQRAISHLWRSVKTTPEVHGIRLYAFPPALAATLPSSPDVHANVIQDLIHYQPAASGPAATQFHRLAANRLRDGCEVFTEVDAGQLVRWHWLWTSAAGACAATTGMPMDLPAGAALIFDSGGRAPFSPGLGHVLRAAAAKPGVTEIYIAVPVSNRVLGDDVIRLGGVQRTYSPPPMPADPTVGAPPSASPLAASAASRPTVET